MSFTHLHLHTEYSLLDGACRIPKLVERIKALGMTSCAITDHGVMYGCIDFYCILDSGNRIFRNSVTYSLIGVATMSASPHFQTCVAGKIL